MEWETHVRTLDLYYYTETQSPWFIYFFKVTDTLSQLPCLGEVKKLSKFQTAKRADSKLPTCNVLGQALSFYNEVTGLLFQCNQIQTMKGATPNYEQGQTEGQAYGMHRSIPNWATMGKQKLSLQINVLTWHLHQPLRYPPLFNSVLSVCAEQQHKLLFWTRHTFGLSRWCTIRVEKINVLPLIILSPTWNGYGRKQINTQNVDLSLEQNNWCQCFTYLFN